MKPLIWTIRIVDRKVPHLWVLHEGPQSVALIERNVAKAKELGFDVVVNLSSKPAQTRGAR